MATKINKKILLESLKKKWIQQNDVDKDVWIENYPYYFKDLKRNLICNMSSTAKNEYAKGAGSEFKWTKRNGKDLPPKMQAIHSSSAMTFNIFGDDTIEIGNNNPIGLPAGKYKIDYERKLPTGVNSAKANIDACLTSEIGEEKEIVFFEMKMTEWLIGNTKKLPEAYLRPKATHLLELSDWTKKFVSLHKTNYFDVVQIILHIWGIYNSVINGDFKEVKKITLICGMWTIENEEFFCRKSEDQYKKYKDIYTKTNDEFEEFHNSLGKIKKLFENKGIKFNVKKVTVKEIIECFGKSNEPYLKRYI